MLVENNVRIMLKFYEINLILGYQTIEDCSDLLFATYMDGKKMATRHDIQSSWNELICENSTNTSYLTAISYAEFWRYSNKSKNFYFEDFSSLETETFEVRKNQWPQKAGYIFIF